MKTFLSSAALLALIAAGPAAAQAATYAYVNNDGEVMTVESATAMNAIMTAPNIDENSGVMIIDSAADQEIVGDDVSGV
jgi:hypothetical protein